MLQLEHLAGGLHHAVGVEAHRVDADLDEELRHVRVVRRRLAAESRVDAVAAAPLDGQPDHLLDAGVALVVVEGDELAVAVHAEGELGEVVRADREPVETLGELVDEHDVVGDLAHRVDLQPVLTALAARARPSAQHLVRLRDAADEREHQHDVGQAHVLADPPHRPALQREALGVRRVGVARRAAEPEHRVLLVRLEVAPAEQAGVLVGLEVGHPHDHRARVEGGGDGADALGEPLHEERRAVGVAGGEALDVARRASGSSTGPGGAARAGGP